MFSACHVQVFAALIKAEKKWDGFQALAAGLEQSKDCADRALLAGRQELQQCKLELQQSNGKVKQLRETNAFLKQQLLMARAGGPAISKQAVIARAGPSCDMAKHADQADQPSTPQLGSTT